MRCGGKRPGIRALLHGKGGSLEEKDPQASLASGDGTVTFYITRHGQTVYNVASRVQGWCDSQLTDEGIRVASLAGPRPGGGPVRAGLLQRCRSRRANAQRGARRQGQGEPAGRTAVHPRSRPAPSRMVLWQPGSGAGGRAALGAHPRLRRGSALRRAEPAPASGGRGAGRPGRHRARGALRPGEGASGKLLQRSGPAGALLRAAATCWWSRIRSWCDRSCTCWILRA